MKDGSLPIPPSMTREDEIEKSFSNLSGVVTSASLPSILIGTNTNSEMLEVIRRWVAVEPADLETVLVMIHGQVHRIASLIVQSEFPLSKVVVLNDLAVIVENNADRGVLVELEEILLKENGKVLVDLVCNHDKEAQTLAKKLGLVEEHLFSGMGPSGDLHGALIDCKPSKKVVVEAFKGGTLMFVDVVDRPPTVQMVEVCVDLAVRRALPTQEKLA